MQIWLKKNQNLEVKIPVFVTRCNYRTLVKFDLNIQKNEANDHEQNTYANMT